MSTTTTITTTIMTPPDKAPSTQPPPHVVLHHKRPRKSQKTLNKELELLNKEPPRWSKHPPKTPGPSNVELLAERINIKACIDEMIGHTLDEIKEMKLIQSKFCSGRSGKFTDEEWKQALGSIGIHIGSGGSLSRTPSTNVAAESLIELASSTSPKEVVVHQDRPLPRPQPEPQPQSQSIQETGSSSNSSSASSSTGTTTTTTTTTVATTPPISKKRKRSPQEVEDQDVLNLYCVFIDVGLDLDRAFTIDDKAFPHLKRIATKYLFISRSQTYNKEQKERGIKRSVQAMRAILAMPPPLETQSSSSS